jgi:hypothetical protein
MRFGFLVEDAFFEPDLSADPGRDKGIIFGYRPFSVTCGYTAGRRPVLIAILR